MGFIPETITRTPASSVVGTAGLDRSGEYIGRAVARTAEVIGSVLKEKEVKRKQTLDITHVKARTREIEAEMDGNAILIQEKYAENPQLAIEETFNSNESLITKTLSNMADDDRRALFASEISTVARRKNREIRTWVRAQEVVNASQDFTLITDTNAAQLMLNPNEDKFWEYIAKNKLRLPHAKGIYKDGADAIEKGNQSMARGLLAGFENKDPHAGLKLIRSGKLNKIFNGEELAKLEDNMKSSIKGWDEQVKFENNLRTLELFGAIDKINKEGKLKTSDVDELELGLDAENLLSPKVQKEVDNLRKIAAEKTDLTAIESGETLAKLHDELRNLFISSDKLTADASLTEIFKFRSHVYSASADGKISPSQRDNFIIQIETIKTTGLLEAEGEKGLAEMFLGEKNIFSLFSEPDTPEQYSYKKVYDWLSSMNFSEEVAQKAKVKILNDTMIEMTELREQGKPVSYDTVDILLERHFREELARQNPSLQNIPPEGVVKRLTNGKKILLFPNGFSVPIK